MSRRRRHHRRLLLAISLAVGVAFLVALQATYAATNTVSGTIRAGNGTAAVKAVSFTTATWTYDANGNATNLTATLAFTPSTQGRLSIRVSSSLPWTTCVIPAGSPSFSCALTSASQGPPGTPTFVYVGS